MSYKFFSIVTVLGLALFLHGCGQSQESLRAKVNAHDARIKSFEENGTLVSDSKGLAVPNEPQVIENAKRQVKENCLAETMGNPNCDNLEVIDHKNGMVTIQYTIK